MQTRLLAAALALAAASTVAAQERVPFSAERSWQIQRIGPPTISPDGRTVVAPVTRYDMGENKGLTDLWLWSTDGRVGRALTTHPASDSSPLVSPDGQAVAFVSQRNGDTAPQLYVLPPQSTLTIHVGKRKIKLRPEELQKVTGERGRRGTLMRGLQRIDRIDIDSPRRASHGDSEE